MEHDRYIINGDSINLEVQAGLNPEQNQEVNFEASNVTEASEMIQLDEEQQDPHENPPEPPENQLQYPHQADQVQECIIPVLHVDLIKLLFKRACIYSWRCRPHNYPKYTYKCACSRKSGTT